MVDFGPPKMAFLTRFGWISVFTLTRFWIFRRYGLFCGTFQEKDILYRNCLIIHHYIVPRMDSSLNVGKFHVVTNLDQIFPCRKVLIRLFGLTQWKKARKARSWCTWYIRHCFFIREILKGHPSWCHLEDHLVEEVYSVLDLFQVIFYFLPW